MILPIRSLATAAIALAVLGCGTDSHAPHPSAPLDAGSEAPSATYVRMDFRRADFYAAPFPSDDLRASDGKILLDRFPNPASNALVAQTLGLLRADARGFATTGGIFLTLSGRIDPTSLPDPNGSIAPSAPVSLVVLDEAAPDFGRRWPVYVAFEADGGPYGSANLMSVVPLQGVSLTPNRLYGVVVTSGVRDATGHAIGPSRDLDALLRGQKPDGLTDDAFARYQAAIHALDKLGVATAVLAGLAAFTTGDPTAETLARIAEVAALPALAVKKAAAAGEVFDQYCVYNTSISMPDYQAGTPPYATEGGAWSYDGAGKLKVARTVDTRVVLTIPRTPMPSSGYPMSILVRTGAGGDRPLVDRGVQAMTGGPALTPGSGLARDFATVGFAGASIDGPHSGARNPANGDEQFLMFNVRNVTSIRDSIRESALELVVFERALEALTLDASSCSGAGPGTVHFDPSRVTIFGHSMGATIAPLVVAAEPRFRALAMSGAGASWMENILFKEQPLAVRPIIDGLVGYPKGERTLHRGDPALTLMQWALEPADPLVYAPLVVRTPPNGATRRHVLVEQGIVDHYIMPTIANAMSLSLGLDLAGPALDSTADELTTNPVQTPLANVLPFVGRGAIDLPASGNVEGTTAVVRQHAGDGVEDGHEVLFQTEPPKAELRCFLLSIAKGTHPPVVTPDACPAETW
jgi:hypothetical protein